MRLDLGCGVAKAPGHIGIDIAQVEGVDITWDLNNGLPPDISENSIDGIRCNQTVEHLNTIIPLMNDCFKVMKSGALLEISTPKAGSEPFWQDPTHKKGYVWESFLYFCEDSPFKNEQEEYGITARFILEEELLRHNWNLIIKLKKP